MLDLDEKKNSEKYMVNGKYTCRFDIQIENDNQFQVARKIIGSNVNIYNNYIKGL